MMETTVFNLRVSPDRSSLLLSIGNGTAAIPAAQLDQMLIAIAQVRSMLLPEVPLDWQGAPPQETLPYSYDPSWRAGYNPDTKSQTLQIRSGGLGWQVFEFSQLEAARLVTTLRTTPNVLTQDN